MRFDLADLSLFRHVVEAGSITHGAGRAHLALAAASTRIRNMEDVLGAPLLVRARHGVTLPRPAVRCCSTPASSWSRPSGCGRTSAPMPAASPGKSGCCPTPMH